MDRFFKLILGCAKMISRLDDMEFFPSNVYDNLSDAD